MKTMYIAAKAGSCECNGSIYPPSIDDILSSAANVTGLSNNIGALIYEIKSKKSEDGYLFISARLNRTHFTPSGTDRIFFRAYRQRASSAYGKPYMPLDVVWSHEESDYPPGDAAITARAWFNQDRSFPGVLLEEKYKGNILISARTIAINPHLTTRGKNETSVVGSNNCGNN